VYRYNDVDIQVDVQLVEDYNRRLVIRGMLKSTRLPWESLNKDIRGAPCYIDQIRSKLSIYT